MARNAQNNQRLNGTWTIAQNQTYFTLAGWINRSGDGTRQIFGAVTNSSTNRTYIDHFSDNNIYIVVSNGGSQFGSVLKSGISGWNHYAFVFDGSQTGNSNRLKAYLNGVQETLSYTGTIPATTSNNIANEAFDINHQPLNNTWGNGNYAEIAGWQEALTGAEISSLAKGFSPSLIRPNKLGMYLPLIREINDIKGHITLTDTNTTVANHPRIYK